MSECVREPLLLSIYFTEEYVSLWCSSVALTCVRRPELFRHCRSNIKRTGQLSFNYRIMFVIGPIFSWFACFSEHSNKSVFNIELTHRGLGMFNSRSLPNLVLNYRETPTRQSIEYSLCTEYEQRLYLSYQI